MTDFCNSAYFIKLIKVGLIIPDVLLSDKENLLIIRHGSFDSM